MLGIVKVCFYLCISLLLILTISFGYDCFSDDHCTFHFGYLEGNQIEYFGEATTPAGIIGVTLLLSLIIGLLFLYKSIIAGAEK